MGDATLLVGVGEAELMMAKMGFAQRRSAVPAASRAPAGGEEVRGRGKKRRALNAALSRIEIIAVR